MVPDIWKKIPQDVIMDGYNRGWLKIKKECTGVLLGKATTKVTVRKATKRDPIN